MKLRLIDQACGCSMVQDGGSLCVPTGACGTEVESACSTDQASSHLRMCWPLQRSLHEAPTDLASLRLLHGARRMPTQGACSVLLVALGWRVLAAPTKHLQIAFVFTLEPP